ncbi:MAG: CoA pyrophosphatase [Candidatus Velthaea sp.]
MRRFAAVVLAIFADAPHRVIFVERAAHLRDHPGQIGLPGGSVDPGDGDRREVTALRELHEEIGVPPAAVTLVARLPDIAQRVNNFIVTPFVGVLAPATKLTFDETETAALFTVPLAEILTPGAVHADIELVGDRRVDTFVFDFGGRHVWGLTGHILRSFVDAWHEPDSGIQAALEAALL